MFTKQCHGFTRPGACRAMWICGETCCLPWCISLCMVSPPAPSVFCQHHGMMEAQVGREQQYVGGASREAAAISKATTSATLVKECLPQTSPLCSRQPQTIEDLLKTSQRLFCRQTSWLAESPTKKTVGSPDTAFALQNLKRSAVSSCWRPTGTSMKGGCLQRVGTALPFLQTSKNSTVGGRSSAKRI